ncbi:MAG: SMC-Scp complex subunit ScpB [Elusimicrobiota bacterium]
MERTQLKQAVETLLFITDQPIGITKISQTVGEKNREAIEAVVTEIQREYEDRGTALQVLEIAEGFQMATRPDNAKYVRNLFKERMAMRLSTAALETLSIIAYKQPLTRAEVEIIRGVEVIAALETLLEKGLICVAGRKESVGRPLLYGTTTDFLRRFGLRSLRDLPPLDSFGGGEAPEGASEEVVAVPSSNGAEEPVEEAMTETDPAAEAVAEKPADPLDDDSILSHDMSDAASWPQDQDGNEPEKTADAD